MADDLVVRDRVAYIEAHLGELEIPDVEWLIEQLAAMTAERDSLKAHLAAEEADRKNSFQMVYDLLTASEAARERMREALEEIAESRDAGRHDGLPEPYPAHSDYEMWGIAIVALAADAPPHTEENPRNDVNDDCALGIVRPGQDSNQ